MPECHRLTPPCHFAIKAPGGGGTMNKNRTVATLADVLALLNQAGLTGTRRRDMVSAVKRLCEMAGTTPASVRAEPPVLKDMLSRIRPAAHGVSAKSYSNLRSLLR